MADNIWREVIKIVVSEKATLIKSLPGINAGRHGLVIRRLNL
jgi:hypothetical protein